MLSTTSTSGSATSSMAGEGCSALARLVDVGLLRHARFRVLGLGAAVDPPVPPDRAALALLVLEAGLLRLQLLDEVGDVGRVGLPEQRHGRGNGNAQRRKSSRRAPADRCAQAGTRRTCRPSRRNACGSPLIQRASSSSLALPTSNAGKTTLTVSKPSRLATWKVTWPESWSGSSRMLLWKSATRSKRFSTNLPFSASRMTSLS